MAEGSYQVLARKWRPQRFEDVVGQSAIVRTLANALDQGRTAHAYCFSGIRGVGKTTIARLLAKGLNCRETAAPSSGPCGRCEACREIEAGRSLDVVEMDAASQTGVDDIRQLNEFARYTPSRDRYRVFIIDEAHMLSDSAFNALLKTLEEPPPHVVFCLATTEPHKILPTVLSRCQHYNFGRISQADIEQRLREIAEAESVQISDDALSLLAMAADGSLRDAQSLLDKVIAFSGDGVDDEVVVDLLGMVDRELLFAAVDRIAAQDLTGVLELVNRLVEQGVDLHQFTLDLLGHLRALLVARTVEDAGGILHLPEEDLERLRQQAAGFELDDLDRAFSLLSASEYRIKTSEVPRYQLEVVLGRLARLPRLEPIESLIEELRGAGASGSGTAGSGTAGATSSGGAVAGSRSAAGRGARGGRLAPPPSAPRPPRPASPAGRPARPQTSSSQPTPRATSPDAPPASTDSASTVRTRNAPPAGFDDAPPAGTHDAPPAGIDDGPPAWVVDGPPPLIDDGPPARGEDGPARSGLPRSDPEARVEDGPARGGPPRIDRETRIDDGPARSGPPRIDPVVSLVLKQLRDKKPMIASVVERAESIELRDDTLFLSFPANGGIFKTRLRDRNALAAVEEAGLAALGRAIKVVAGFGPEQEEGGTADPEPELAVAAGRTPSPTADGAADARKQELWQRAEREPMVQRFIETLKGNLTDVEEI